MDTNRLPKQAQQYRPIGRRNIGRARKRCRDQLILRIKEQETRLTLQEHDDDGDLEIEEIERTVSNEIKDVCHCSDQKLSSCRVLSTLKIK